MGHVCKGSKYHYDKVEEWYGCEGVIGFPAAVPDVVLGLR